MTPIFKQGRRRSFESLVHIVKTELPFIVHRSDEARILPEENVLAPTQSSPPIKRHASAANGNGEDQELHGERETDDHQYELRRLEDAAFCGDPMSMPFRIDPVATNNATTRGMPSHHHASFQPGSLVKGRKGPADLGSGRGSLALHEPLRPARGAARSAISPLGSPMELRQEEFMTLLRQSRGFALGDGVMG